MITLLRTIGDVGEMLSMTLASEKSNNRRYLLKFAQVYKIIAKTRIEHRDSELEG